MVVEGMDIPDLPPMLPTVTGAVSVPSSRDNGEVMFSEEAETSTEPMALSVPETTEQQFQLMADKWSRRVQVGGAPSY